MDLVEQGRTFDFDFELSGTDALGFTVPFSVMQYAGDTPLITRNMTVSNGKYIGSLTGSETASLTAGTQYFIHMNATDADEDLSKKLKIYITKGWA